MADPQESRVRLELEVNNAFKEQRDELSETIERCHKMLDKHYGESDDTTSLEPLDGRLKCLLDEAGAQATLLRSWLACMRSPRPSDWELIVKHLLEDTTEALNG